MSRQQRQIGMLAVLLVVLTVVLLRPLAGPGSGVDSGGLLGEFGEVRGELPDQVVKLDLAELERKPATFRPGRDPFRFEAPPRPQQAQQPQQARPAPPPPPPPPAAQRNPQPPRPQPPPVDFVYLGSFGPSGRQIAVFIDQAEIYNARVGDTVKEKFVVREIGYESADIGFVEFPNEPARRLAVGG